MPPKQWSRAATFRPKQSISEFVVAEVRANNLLQLEEKELANMANILETCATKKEVFDWAETLMMDEAFAAEIIKRRDDYGPYFGDRPAASSTAGTPSLPPSGAQSSAKSGPGGGSLKTCRKGNRRTDIRKKGTGTEAKGSASALKPGKFECGCFASIHKYVGNCANCGRIICEQEDEAVCYFCGLETHFCLQYEIKIQDGLLSEAALQENRAAYQSALERRDTLLHFAENSAKRTVVIDDQSVSAAFATKDAWMSPKEREDVDQAAAAAERRRQVEARHRATGAYTVHLDIVNKNISLGATELTLPQEESAQEADGVVGGRLHSSGSENETIGDDGCSDGELAVVENVRAVPLPSLLEKIWYNPNGVGFEFDGSLKPGSAPRAAGSESDCPTTVKPILKRDERVSTRVQQDYFADDEALYEEGLHERALAMRQGASSPLGECTSPNDLDEVEVDGGGPEAAVATSVIAPEEPSRLHFAPTVPMRLNDTGMCLSMHQPWASLLISGIKVHEGRTWSTEYRGRLWIHAASAQPQRIAEVEEKYARFCPAGKKLPSYYPTRVLLGYVYVTGCLSKEEYETEFSEEERQEESPFTFICVEPRSLPFPLPMEGNHKLFKLEHKVHTAAKKQLKEIS